MDKSNDGDNFLRELIKGFKEENERARAGGSADSRSYEKAYECCASRKHSAEGLLRLSRVGPEWLFVAVGVLSTELDGVTHALIHIAYELAQLHGHLHEKSG